MPKRREVPETVEELRERWRVNQLRKSHGLARTYSERIDHGDGPISIPAEILEDRTRRLRADRSLTSLICGDPAPGQSALDKMRTAR